MNRWIACGLLASVIVFCVNGQSQIIDTIQIKTSTIRSSNFGSSTQKLEGNGSIADQLAQSGAVFIKNYGPGSLATSSIRGGSASHTLVLWNDLPIQNPFLGLLDLSLLDTWAMNDVNLQKGGNAVMWGSGAIGGVISMEQKNAETEKFKFSNDFSIGSFGRIKERAKLSFSKGPFRSISSYSILKAENDFPYKSLADTLIYQTNAEQFQESFNQDVYVTLKGRNEIALHYWRSRALRENPPTTVQSKSEAYQEDKADRISAQWKYIGENTKLKVNTGYFIEDLDYFDPQILLESKTHFETFVFDVSSEVKLRSNHKFSHGISYYHTTVNSPANYEEAAAEARIAAFLTYQFKFFQLSFRQELVDGKLIPFMPALALNLPLIKNTRLMAKVGRNYRLPTLNDRFWNPGGNPNLLEESGWSEELGLSYKGKTIEGSATVFNRVIDNWIQWSVLPGERTLSPYNLNRVWSRGVELNARFKHKIMHFEIAYNLIKSTNTRSVQFPKIDVGDQLFYTPVHTGNASITIPYKKWKWTYQQYFTSQTLGINENLEPWTIGNMSISFDLNRIGFYANLYNTWNTQYRVVERRPMPGRHFELGFNLNFIND